MIRVIHFENVFQRELDEFYLVDVDPKDIKKNKFFVCKGKK